LRLPNPFPWLGLLFVLGRKALGWDRYEELCDGIGLLGGSRLGLYSRRISYGAKNDNLAGE
jgi:hypothetical protein